ncbi:MAG: 16S rRNA (uracil(1498)-N(3))-methyltransferase, partial [Oscillospiraceae bacterium]|nr:16S rRNA (uracil(1498)-N(3))-methyltransferase [Oscillospiraceae bacterium]
MPKFFVSSVGLQGDSVILHGEDAAHIAKTLRMRAGDPLTVCDGAGTDYLCTLLSVSPECAEARLDASMPCPGEPQLDLTLCMALPKSDKLELVVQKAVELGAARVCVFRSGFCVPDPDPRAFAKRLVRLEKIAREAAGQSLRGRIPEIAGLYGFEEVLEKTKDCELPLFFYEKG